MGFEPSAKGTLFFQKAYGWMKLDPVVQLLATLGLYFTNLPGPSKLQLKHGLVNIIFMGTDAGSDLYQCCSHVQSTIQQRLGSYNSTNVGRKQNNHMTLGHRFLKGFICHSLTMYPFNRGPPNGIGRIASASNGRQLGNFRA